MIAIVVFSESVVKNDKEKGKTYRLPGTVVRDAYINGVIIINK